MAAEDAVVLAKSCATCPTSPGPWPPTRGCAASGSSGSSPRAGGPAAPRPPAWSAGSCATWPCPGLQAARHRPLDGLDLRPSRRPGRPPGGDEQPVAAGLQLRRSTGTAVAKSKPVSSSSRSQVARGNRLDARSWTADRAAGLAQQVGVVDGVGGVERVGVPGPLPGSGRPARRRRGRPVGAGAEVLPQVVGRRTGPPRPAGSGRTPSPSPCGGRPRWSCRRSRRGRRRRRTPGRGGPPACRPRCSSSGLSSRLTSSMPSDRSTRVSRSGP